MAKMTRTKTKENNVTEEKIQETKVIRPVVKQKRFQKDDYIPVRSVTVGGLWLDGKKSGETYRWTDYGDVTEVEYQDLASLVRNVNNGYIYGPMIIIEDDDFIAEFPNLGKFYDEQYTVEELSGVLDLSTNDMIATLKTLPKGALNSIKSIASTKVSNGQLDSLSKIKALDEFFGTELNLLSNI